MSRRILSLNHGARERAMAIGKTSEGTGVGSWLDGSYLCVNYGNPVCELVIEIIHAWCSWTG